MAPVAFAHILLEFSGKEQWTDIFHQSLGIQPARNECFES